MSDRSKLITEAGGIYRNYRSAYSFENPEKREVYFGAWEHLTDPNGVQKIFGMDWKYDKGRKKNSFDQAVRCIDLVLIKGYKLFTFSMKAKEHRKLDRDEIESIGELVPKILSVKGFYYFAYPETALPPMQEPIARKYTEGAKRTIEQTIYERCPEARKACLDKFGFFCRICGFDFEKTYGEAGAGYIHVHHLELISKKGGSYEIDPKKDLRPVCPNCHAIIHKQRDPYSINDVRKMLGKDLLEPDE